MDTKKPDPEMLKELDFLLNMEAVDEESDWETLAQMESLEKDQTENDSEKGGNK